MVIGSAVDGVRRQSFEWPFKATSQNFFVCVDKSKYKSIVVRHVNG
jgi:hypothetical protein